MGTWVVVFVFVAISAFVLNDLFSGQSAIFSSTSNDVGEIAGIDISLEEYQNAIREREANYFLNFNREPGERERPFIEQQAWEMLVAKYAIQSQYAKVGVDVTTDEVLDMLLGKHIDENLKSTPLFLDETGQFDRNKVQNYLNSIKNEPATSEARIRWEMYQKDLAPARERIKYENLLIKTTYVTAAEAERNYHMQNDVAEVRYLYVPYYHVKDSAVTVSESDYQEYYNENKERFKSEHVRDLNYVSFNVVPSADDSLAVREILEQLKPGLEKSENDSTFAEVNSTNDNPYARYFPSELPPYLSNEELQPGKIIGPFLDGGTYKLVKISRIGKDTVFNARARHILITWTDDPDSTVLEGNKKTAKERARKLLQDLKAGKADFAEKAREINTDASAQKGGDLGWFTSGVMVKPFDDAIFGATRAGLLNDVVETQYGYHIIDITNVKDNTAYWVVTLAEEIAPSDETINATRRQAELFQAEISGVEDFKTKAGNQGLTVMEAKGVQANDRRVGVLGDARAVVRWLFSEASTGEVSDVFDLQDQYAVCVMTGEVDKGYKPLADVKSEILPAVRNRVKGKMIADELKGASGTLDEIATKTGPDASVFSNSSLKLTANSLATVGMVPKGVGTVFGLEAGKRTEPLTGDNGVIIIEVQSKTVAPETGDYATYQTQLKQEMSNRAQYSIADAIKGSSNIVDTRYKFY